MTFSNEIREEVTSIKLFKKNEMIVFLDAVIIFSGIFLKNENDIINFEIKTENLFVAKKIQYIFRKIFSITLEINQKNNYNFGRNQFYILNYPNNNNDIVEKLSILNIFVSKDRLREIKTDLVFFESYSENDIKIFLRVLYMMCGSINNPEKNYHLEFLIHDNNLANSILNLLISLNLSAHMTSRKDISIVYIKDSENISDFLNLIGAHNSMFKFEDIRIEKNVRNNINRVVNCETANLSRIAKSFSRQKKSIEYLINSKKIDLLPDDLKELAFLRLSNDSDSLKELGEKLSVSLSKSGVNYKLKKIESIANKFLEEDFSDDKKRDTNIK